MMPDPVVETYAPELTREEATYTSEDVERRVPVVLKMPGATHSAYLLGMGPETAFVLARAELTPGTMCTLSLDRLRDHPAKRVTGFQFRDAEVVHSAQGWLDENECSLLYLRCGPDLSRFFMGIEVGRGRSEYTCIPIPIEVVDMLAMTRHAHYLTDSEGRTIFITQSECDITGLGETKILGYDRKRMWWDPDERAEFLRELREKGHQSPPESLTKEGLKWKKAMSTGEFEPRFLATTSLWKTGTDGGFVGVSGIYHDTTELVGLRDKSRQLEDSQAARRNVQAMSKLIRVMSHQTRSPLVNIMAVAGDIVDGLIHVTEAKPHCEEMHSLAEASLNLFPKLRLLSRALDFEDEPLEPVRSWIEIQPFVTDVVSGLRGYAKLHNLRLRFEGPGLKGVELYADPDLLRQAMISLVDNAVKYGQAGTVIHVEGQLSSNYLTLSVRNIGIPLRGEYLERIFEMDFRAPEAEAVSADGTGLGLWFCKYIMDLHGCEVEARGTDTSGYTKFELRFPNDMNTIRSGVRDVRER